MPDAFERAIQQQLARDARSSDDYPSVLVGGHRLHVFKEPDGWQAWLNTEDRDFDGLCIARGVSRLDVLIEARRVLMALMFHIGTTYLKENRSGH